MKKNKEKIIKVSSKWLQNIEDEMIEGMEEIVKACERSANLLK